MEAYFDTVSCYDLEGAILKSEGIRFNCNFQTGTAEVLEGLLDMGEGQGEGVTLKVTTQEQAPA